LHSAQRERRRLDNHLACIHSKRGATHLELSPIRMASVFRTGKEVPLQPGVRKRVSRAVQIDVSLIGHGVVHPHEEVRRQ
jgi:hypothetical protein